MTNLEKLRQLDLEDTARFIMGITVGALRTDFSDSCVYAIDEGHIIRWLYSEYKPTKAEQLEVYLPEGPLSDIFIDRLMDKIDEVNASDDDEREDFDDSDDENDSTDEELKDKFKNIYQGYLDLYRKLNDLPIDDDLDNCVYFDDNLDEFDADETTYEDDDDQHYGYST